MKKALIKSLFFIAVVCAALLNGCHKKQDPKTNDKPPVKDGFVVVCDTVPTKDTVRLKADEKGMQYYQLHKDWKNNKDYTVCIDIEDSKDEIDHVELLIVKKNHDVVHRWLLVKGWQQFTQHNTEGRFTPYVVLIFHRKGGKTDYPMPAQVDETACKTGQTQKENAKVEASKNLTVLVSLDED